MHPYHAALGLGIAWLLRAERVFALVQEPIRLQCDGMARRARRTPPGPSGIECGSGLKGGAQRRTCPIKLSSLSRPVKHANQPFLIVLYMLARFGAAFWRRHMRKGLASDRFIEPC